MTELTCIDEHPASSVQWFGGGEMFLCLCVFFFCRGGLYNLWIGEVKSVFLLFCIFGYFFGGGGQYLVSNMRGR